MPDLKSELSKVLNEWNPPEPTTMTTPHRKITTNTTRATFEKAVENPGITRAALIEALDRDGYKQSSTSSLITQLLANGNFRLVGDGLFVTQEEYKPLPRMTPVKRRVSKDAPATVPEVKVEPPAKPTSAQLLDTLSIVQARELYDELRRIFGG
jgi:hypothetical protein